MLIASLLLLAQTDTSWAEFKTELFSYGKLVMQLPQPCKIDTIKTQDYTVYTIKSQAFKPFLSIMMAWKLPHGFKGRTDLVVASRQRQPVAGTNGMASRGTYKTKPGQWFEFISHNLFGRDVYLRIWYENASDQDVAVIDSVISTIKAVSK